VARSIERLREMHDVRRVAVMPDVHLASNVCVGVALATSRTIYPAAVGSDIGCGMAAIGFEAGADLLADERAAAIILAGLGRKIPALKRSRASSEETELPDHLLRQPLSTSRLEKLKARDSKWQFGTLGRGNHFVELQADDQDRLWLMVHSGSRGMGQAITAHHTVRAAAPRGELPSFDADAAEGQAYLADASWAESYAAANRLAIVAAVKEILAESFGVAAIGESLIHSNHNHLRRETHGGQPLWVHRKGALSAAAGERGVIPGSMGLASFHVVGRGEAASLCSSSHGAGRQLRRGEAAKRIGVKTLERELRGVWFDHRRAAALRDEAPSAYKDIHAVMRAQRELTKIERSLRPLLCYKG
jgi:tRNA-splicing ligase RtcB